MKEPLSKTAILEGLLYTMGRPVGAKFIADALEIEKTAVDALISELEVELSIDVVALEEVIVSSQREKNINSIQMGLTTIDPKKVSTLPAFLGEKDIIRVAISTAGVQNVGEGAAGINIRAAVVQCNLIQVLTTWCWVFACDAGLTQMIRGKIDCTSDRFDGKIS